MVCPKCGSENVTMQAVSIVSTKGHGVAWWLFVSWWIWIVWLFWFIPMLIIKLIRGKKTKTKIKSEAVCQNCGHHWRV